jgi:hypothetical protein
MDRNIMKVQPYNIKTTKVITNVQTQNKTYVTLLSLKNHLS